jgi:hypothetical protein
LALSSTKSSKKPYAARDPQFGFIPSLIWYILRLNYEGILRRILKKAIVGNFKIIKMHLRGGNPGNSIKVTGNLAQVRICFCRVKLPLAVLLTSSRKDGHCASNRIDVYFLGPVK